MRIDVISSHEDLERLKANWEELYRADPDAQYFLSWPFISTYIRRFPGRWFVLAARSGSGSSPYVALMPLRLGTMMNGKTGLFYNEIHMGGAYVADYTGAVCAPEFAQAAMAAFAKHLRKMHWARLHLTDLRMSPARERAFFKNLDDERLTVREVSRWDKIGNIDNSICPFAELPETWEAYLEKKVSANTRQKLRRLLRKVEGSEDFRITLADASTIERDIEILLGFWRTKWGPRKGDRLAGIQRTHRRLFLDALADGSLFLPVLWHRDRPLGGLAIFVDPVKKTYFFYLAGRDEETDIVPSGLVLHAYSIRHAIENGFRTYDFLRGNESYKYSFATNERANRSRLLRTRSDRNLGDKLDARSLLSVFRQANRFHKDGRLDKAESAYRQILDTDPVHAPTLYGLGQLQAGRGEHQRAARTFATLTRAAPDLAKGWARHGEALQALNRLAEAAQSFYAAIKLDPQMAAPRYGLGLSLAHLGHPERAIALLRTVLRLRPRDPADEPLRVRTAALLKKLEQAQRSGALPLWNAVAPSAQRAPVVAEVANAGVRLMPSLAQSVAIIGPPQAGPVIKRMPARLRS